MIATPTFTSHHSEPVHANRSTQIIVDQVSLTYRPAWEEPVLDQINLELEQSELVCVLGPSGCGKTSLLHILAGYIPPTRGTVRINGKEHKAPNSSVGVVFQHANLFPWLSIAGNVEFGMKMKGIPKPLRKEKAAHYLQLVGLQEAASKLPHQLSGGMKQRAAIARTLATDPSIVLMDEPFSALDALTRESMQIHVRELWAKTQKCIMFITHDVDEALLLSSRILIMHARPGRIVQDFRNPLYSENKARNFNELRADRQFLELRESLLSHIASV
ncbi:ABC transporter ATP-binding protein [Paenibacillus shirakamiensis]|nr:ABC transporter ATP-binding protein [Paenibacillus shirakamiensis]